MSKPVAEIIHFRHQESPYVCSACGADRGCDCNAPAVERLAAKTEQDRKRARAYRERKAAASRDADVDKTEEIERDRKECIALYQRVTDAEKELEEAEAKRRKAASRDRKPEYGDPVDAPQANKFHREITNVVSDLERRLVKWRETKPASDAKECVINALLVMSENLIGLATQLRD
jgi:hypothetical protein